MIAKQEAVYRIGIDARFYRKATAGLGRYSRELIQHLTRLDSHNQYFVFLTEADFLEWDIQQENFHPVVVPVAHYTLAEQTKFVRILYKHRLDLVHFLNFNHPLLYRRPFVVTLHDLTLVQFPAGRSKKSRLRRAAYLTVMKDAIRRAKRVIAISEYTAQDAAKQLNVSHAKMEVIYEGGPDLFEPPFGCRASVQSFLNSNEPYFLFVSQWRPHKGILTLMEAFKLLKERHSLPHKLVLVGNQQAADPEVRQALSDSTVTDDIVTPGFVPDEILSCLFSRATAFIMPSEYEGFGLPVLEAFAYGAPAIVAQNSSLVEVTGEAGLLFPTRDAEALAAHMLALAQDEALRQQLIQKGQQQLRKFSWEKMSQQTLALYHSVLEKRR